MASSDEAPVARLADTLCSRFDGETESLSGSDLDDAARRSPVDERTDRRRLLAASHRPSVLQREQDWEDMKTHPWRPHERVSIASAIRQSFTGAQGFMESTEKILGAKGGLKRKQHRNQVARDLIARLDDCYLKVESIADASSTSPHRRAPPSFEDVGTFPFKLHAPDGDEYPLKAPKPYMELYGDRWWFVKLFAHPQVVTRLLRQLWPHLFVVALFQLGINALTALDVDPPVSVLRELEATQHLLGAVLSLLLVFRTNSAYERYYDGKKQYGIIANQVRQIIMNAYAFISFHEDPTGRLRQRYGRGLELDDEHEAESLHELRERVRRQAIVLFAVLRQDLRERRCGFVPSSTLKHVPFTRHTWILDPSRPRLVDLLTPREIVDFGRVSSGSRVMLACHNLMDALQRLAPRIAQDKPFTDACTRNVQDLIDAAKSCQRIVDTPLPFTYTLILGVLLFIFVYSFPFIYWYETVRKSNSELDYLCGPPRHRVDAATGPTSRRWPGNSTETTSRRWRGAPEIRFPHRYKRHHHHNKVSQWHDFTGLIPAMFTTFFYYGVMQIAIDVENPFNFADVDHDLDSFSKRLHDETLVVAREVAPPGTRCRDYWITERKFAARDGSKRKKKKRTGEGYFKQVSEKLVTYHDEL